MLIDNQHYPYLIIRHTFFNRKSCSIHSFSEDRTIKQQDLMYNKFISLIYSTPEFSNVRYCYAHNFSGFDGVFILNHLAKFKDEND